MERSGKEEVEEEEEAEEEAEEEEFVEEGDEGEGIVDANEFWGPFPLLFSLRTSG